MSRRFVRIYKSLDVKEIQRQLLIYGDIAAICANCQAVDLKLDTVQCPGCQAEFKYIAFRNIKSHVAKLSRLADERPDVVFVDYEDFKRNLSALRAEEFLQ